MRAAFHTLGCKVNQYETESLREQFAGAGFEIVEEDQVADVYIINTCTVTNLADRKSRQFIRQASRRNPEALIAVTGCYAQMKPEEITAIEGVEIVCGTSEKGKLLQEVKEHLAEQNHSASVHVRAYEDLTGYEEMPEIAGMESRSRAFVKIEEGCDRFCSYCVIPFARGQVRSRSEEDIAREVEHLVGAGYKEIVLTGINTALYGAERDGQGMESLLDRLNQVPGEFRIRLSSLEPTVVNRDFVKKLFRFDRLCHHLHLSVQSGSDHVLGLMNRHYSRQDYLDIVKELRDFDPHYGITTDIIVGFPEETEADFQDSVKMVEEGMLSRVHVFKYSKRDGTKAAAMKNQISGTVKSERSHKLMEQAAEISKKFYQDSIGEVRRILVETMDEDWASGYTDNYIKVYVPAESVRFNEFYDVELTDIYEDGMRGNVASRKEG